MSWCTIDQKYMYVFYVFAYIHIIYVIYIPTYICGWYLIDEYIVWTSMGHSWPSRLVECLLKLEGGNEVQSTLSAAGNILLDSGKLYTRCCCLRTSKIIELRSTYTPLTPPISLINSPMCVFYAYFISAVWKIDKQLGTLSDVGWTEKIEKNALKLFTNFRIAWSHFG